MATITIPAASTAGVERLRLCRHIGARCMTTRCFTQGRNPASLKQVDGDVASGRLRQRVPRERQLRGLRRGTLPVSKDASYVSTNAGQELRARSRTAERR